jgi:hypothetical protein
MNTHLRSADPQLPLSLLFLAVVENARHERHMRVAESEQDEIREFERLLEEPERWDGMV